MNSRPSKKQENTRDYGGSLYKTRAGRALPRPIATACSMHLVLRSDLAKGAWRLNTKQNRAKVEKIIKKCEKQYQVKVLRFAIVVNHLHLHIQLRKRALYLGFIRAITAGIAMAVTGWGRGNPRLGKKRFWEGRPFTKFVVSAKQFLRLDRYIKINQLEGIGYSRQGARFTLAWEDST